MKQYGRQKIEDDDIDAVVRVLKSEFLTTGPEVATFERKFAAKIGAKHAIAVSSGTAALHVAMLGLGIGPGDRVVTSPNSFLASANCAAYVGARPDFCDIDPVSRNLDPTRLEAGWVKDTKAVVAVDYAGQPADMPKIAEVARKRGAFVIQDASHGVGTSFQYDGDTYFTGAHPWADVTTFSFHPVKTITAGEGGMLTTDDPELADRFRMIRNHGMTRNQSEFLGSDEILQEKGSWYYEMQALGFNYRITDFQCALAASQLGKLDRFIAKRAEGVTCYNELLENVSWLRRPEMGTWLGDTRMEQVSWHLYSVEIDFNALGLSRVDVIDRLKAQGIGTQVLYIPIYLQPWYQKQYGYRGGKCPLAESFYEGSLSLPLHPSLSKEDIHFVSNALLELA